MREADTGIRMDERISFPWPRATGDCLSSSGSATNALPSHAQTLERHVSSSSVVVILATTYSSIAKRLKALSGQQTRATQHPRLAHLSDDGDLHHLRGARQP